ncbi:MAG TPA: cupin domain-containing protein [Conexibacter sp.]|nr:cupin domain-containing protein [Conexibacter sp.]
MAVPLLRRGRRDLHPLRRAHEPPRQQRADRAQPDDRRGRRYGARMRNLPLLLAVALVAALGGAATVLAITPVSPPPVVRTALAEAPNPAGAPDKTLGLSRVTVAPGGALPLHRHPGTQTAYIARGALTYTVVTGKVVVRRGNPETDARVVRTITSGQTAVIGAGSWIVERPGTIHRAANRGGKQIVIWLATLFRTGAPSAILVTSPAKP